MKKNMISLVTMVASLALLCSCENKEAKIWAEIQHKPTAANVQLYLADFPEGDHIMEVNTFYKPHLESLGVVDSSNDYNDFIEFADKVAGDSLHTYLINQADSLLWASIAQEPTPEKCNLYKQHFPYTARADSAQKLLAEFQRKKVDAEINNLMGELKKEVRRFLKDCPRGWSWDNMQMIRRGAAYSESCETMHKRLLNYKDQMTPEQLQELNRLHNTFTNHQ